MAPVIDLVRHYQHNIEKYPSDKQRVLRAIDKLFHLDVKVQHLQDTGVGRTVNALRKQPEEVGKAARALVYKWKCMVAAEESDQEGDHNESTIHQGYGNGKDSDDSNKRQEQYERPSAENRPEQTSGTKQINGDYNGSKRKYQSSEEEEPERKKSKHSSSERDCSKRKHQQSTSDHTDSESDKSDGSHGDESDHDSSNSSEEEDIKPPHKIKTEHLDRPIKTELIDNVHATSPAKYSSTSYDYIQVKKEPSSSKHSHSSSDKHSKHIKTESRHLDSSSSKEKSHSSHRDKSVKDKESGFADKKSKSNDRPDKEKHHKESKSSIKQSSHSHKSSSQTIESPPERNSSQQRTESGSERHRSSSQKNESSSEKHKSHSSKVKSEKHSSSSSNKADKEKHNSSLSKELSVDKHKSSDYSSSSKDKSSSSKEKSKHSSSKERSSNHKSEKKHSSSSDKSKSGDSKDKVDKKVSKSSEKKSSHSSSSSSHKSKSKEDKPKKKVNVNNSDESDGDGIDCGSGASFAEVLGMITPTKSGKKKSTSAKDIQSPNNSFNNDLSAASMLAPTAKLAPLPALEISALPDISPNYKPRPPPKFLPHFSDEDAMSHVISSKNQRTKVYSGNKIIGKIPTLYEMCVQVLQEHIDALEYTGGVPYEILKPVVDRATPQQLFMLEHYNPYLMEDTDHLWQKFCEKSFRNKKREEMETWREMYIRCQEEQEHRLKSLTANIRMTQEAKKAPIKQTKMAYVDSVVKPPRNIARKQALHGTAHSAAASPAARVASLARAPNVLKGGARPVPAPAVSHATFAKPKKAPLMQKALQFMRGRKR